MKIYHSYILSNNLFITGYTGYTGPPNQNIFQQQQHQNVFQHQQQYPNGHQQQQYGNFPQEQYSNGNQAGLAQDQVPFQHHQYVGHNQTQQYDGGQNQNMYHQQNHVSQRPHNPVLESKQQVQYPSQTNQIGSVPRQQAGPGDQLTQNSTAVRQSFQHVTKPQQV